MREFQPIDGERHIELFWHGPFQLGSDGKLGASPLEPEDALPNSSGVYAVTADHPLQGPRTLFYIGKTSRMLSDRLSEHSWLREEWRVEIYAADVPSELVDDVEKLLIYAHTPTSNERSISKPPNLARPLRIWNRGRFWGLYPEVSSEHNWFQPYERGRGTP